MKYKPSLYTIETTLGCNLKCPGCMLGSGLVNRKPQFLSFDNFKIISDKIESYVRYCFLHNWGEPLLNPEILDIINYGRNKYRVHIATNGQNIDKHFADELVKSKVDVCISLDGMTQDVYEKYRVNGSVQKVYDAIDYMLEAKNKYNKQFDIQVQFIAFEHNKHQINDFKTYCKNKNVKESIKNQ